MANKGDRVEMDEEKLSDALEGKEEKKIDEKCIKKGIEIESKEHPSLDKKTISTLVMDHLKEDEKYYDEYEDEDEDEKEEEKE